MGHLSVSYTHLDVYKRQILALDAFLPYVDNWATCDLMRPNVFRKHLPELLTQIQIWMASEHPYTVRFGIETVSYTHLYSSGVHPLYF